MSPEGLSAVLVGLFLRVLSVFLVFVKCVVQENGEMFCCSCLLFCSSSCACLERVCHFLYIPLLLFSFPSSYNFFPAFPLFSIDLLLLFLFLFFLLLFPVFLSIDFSSYDVSVFHTSHAVPFTPFFSFHSSSNPSTSFPVFLSISF